MCGIGGFSGDFERALLGRMNHAQAHRGPDDEGEVWLPEQQVGLCHRRLSIIDLSAAGRQPMFDASGRLCVVFNGEIYNYRELRTELVTRGESFVSNTDTEVLLHLYRLDGEQMLSRLDGMFAFALWDSAQQRLLIARDGFGVKPLYYSEGPRGFVFSSELKALLQEPSVPRDIDAQAVANYVTYLWCPHPRTMLQSVRKLPPGHALSVQQGRIARQWQFYELPAPEQAAIRVDDAKRELRRRLASSVEKQMVADVPVGAFLSGGLDSSSIVAFAREHAKERRLQCFTMSFSPEAWREEGMTEDLPYAKRVAAHLGVELHTVSVGPEMAQGFANMVYQLDEPQADPAALNVLFISRLARQHGMKVLLSGAGGDDLFSGYRRHFAVSLERYWSWLPHRATRALRVASNAMMGPRASQRRLVKALAHAGEDDAERIAGYFEWTDPLSRVYLLHAAVRSELSRGVGRNPLVESLRHLPASATPLDKMLYLDAKHFLADHNLAYTDRMSMAASVEVRVPFLDPALAAFAATLPDGLKQRRGTGKWIFKQAMEGILPHDVIYRPKTGFGVPLRRWLQYELAPLVAEYLADDVVRRRGLFNASGVRRLLRQHRAGQVDGAYTLMALMCVEMWCRAFLDGARA